MRPFLFAASLAVAVALGACATDTSADADVLPPTSPVQGQEPVQTVPDDPPGPAEPLPESVDQGPEP